jgi:hypothetical protein
MCACATLFSCCNSAVVGEEATSAAGIFTVCCTDTNVVVVVDLDP